MRDSKEHEQPHEAQAQQQQTQQHEERRQRRERRYEQQEQQEQQREEPVILWFSNMRDNVVGEVAKRILDVIKLYKDVSLKSCMSYGSMAAKIVFDTLDRAGYPPITLDENISMYVVVHQDIHIFVSYREYIDKCYNSNYMADGYGYRYVHKVVRK